MMKTAMVLLMTGLMIDLSALITIGYLIQHLPKRDRGKFVIMQRSFRVLLIASVIALMVGSVFCAIGFLMDSL